MAGKVAQWLQDHKDYPHDYCLIWPFARESRVGRGQLSLPGKSRWAHRVMCEMVNGPPPTPKHQAAHECGKGHKGCVNPRHLRWKTNTENQLDRAAHGTVIRRWSHKISAEQADEMRELRASKTQVEIAALFGCSLGTVQYYLKYREQRGHGPKRRHLSTTQ